MNKISSAGKEIKEMSQRRGSVDSAASLNGAVAWIRFVTVHFAGTRTRPGISFIRF